MADKTRTIGATGRQHSTIVAWEGQLDNGSFYASGDVAIGHCYDDAEFDETTLVINGGDTIGLDHWHLTSEPTVGTNRHDGTPDSGARVTTSNSQSYIITQAQNPSLTNSIAHNQISWLEIHGLTYAGSCNAIVGSRLSCTYHHNLVYDIANTTSYWHQVIGISTGAYASQNTIRNIVWNVQNKGSGGDAVGSRAFAISTSTTTSHIINNTCWSTTSVSEASSGINGGTDVINNLVVGCNDGDGLDFTGTPGGTEDYNASSDSSSAGANSITTASTSDFVSTSPVDLHIVTGAVGKGEGDDLTTTYLDVEFDIDGTDIHTDTSNDPWDIGAHEFVAAGGATFVPKIWISKYESILKWFVPAFVLASMTVLEKNPEMTRRGLFNISNWFKEKEDGND